MDSKLKNGMLDACVLSCLLKADSYGYSIVRELSGKVEISESTLYPILRRLEAGQQLSVYSVEHNGRLRKVYSITAEGRSQLDQFYQSRQDVLRAYEFIGREISHDEA